MLPCEKVDEVISEWRKSSDDYFKWATAGFFLSAFWSGKDAITETLIPGIATLVIEYPVPDSNVDGCVLALSSAYPHVSNYSKLAIRDAISSLKNKSLDRLSEESLAFVNSVLQD